jgi:hypothetical protein
MRRLAGTTVAAVVLALALPGELCHVESVSG